MPTSRLLALVFLCFLGNGCRTIEIADEALLRPMPHDTARMAALLSNAPAGTRMRQGWITASDGATLHTLSFINPAATETVLYFGGNMFTIAAMGREATHYLLPLNVSLVLLDYRGYGLSTGRPSTIEAFEADALTVYDAVRSDPDLGRTPIIVHGHSLGSFAAGYVAEQRELPAVVLESSVTTGDEWLSFADSRPWYIRLVTRLRIHDRLRASGNLTRMSVISEPTLLLVGSADAITPPVLSQRLFDSAILSRHRELHVLQGAGHNDVPRHALFKQIYTTFLSRIRNEDH